MSRELFDNLITEFGATVGIGDLAPDEGGFLALAINDFVLNIQHEPEKDEILLFAKLGTVDDPNPVPIYEKTPGWKPLLARYGRGDIID